MKSRENAPQITAIIPTYQRPKLLERAIKSVLKQTYQNLQICVCDNASGDETKETVLKISQEDSRVVYHEHNENIGAVNNFNSGLNMVNSPYFSLLSDDNLLLPNFYDDAINALNLNPKAIFFSGQTLRVTSDFKKISGSLDKWKQGLISPPMGLIHVLEKGIPVWESVLFRSRVLKKVGLLDPSFKHACDQDYIMRIARYYSFYVSKKPCALFFVHDESWSANRKLREVLPILTKRMERYLEDEDLPKALRERIAKILKIRRNTSIRHFVFNQTIIGKSDEPLNTALSIMKKENNLSPRATSLIKFAKYVSQNRIIHNVVSSLIKKYILLKKKVIFIKNIGNYKDYKRITIDS
ncbi:MAG: glycosyltransferase [Candidatus Lokiarchaeota archaeon]|nr:glycosyltransferase [Candidatus Lokiarchaeota archaeon]